MEGLPLDECGKRYLGLEHGHQLRTLHRQIVSELRALARRRADSRWRLIGVDVGARGSAGASEAPFPPPLLDWARAKGLDDWSEAELIEMYREAFPPNPEAERKLRRGTRLRQHQLAVLAELERVAAVPARATDPVDAWFEPVVAGRMQKAGFVTLDDLARVIRIGGRWWRGMPSIGPTKAARITGLLASLLPQSQAHQTRPHETLSRGPIGTRPPLLTAVSLAGLDGSKGTNRANRAPTVDAANDLQAIRSWVAATARSEATATVYTREAERWLMWCVLERGKPQSSAGPDDCVAYMQFLNHIPDEWVSRRKAARLELGWTPFRGQLGLAGRRLAVKVLHLMCGWLTQHARYLDSNPWAAVNRGLVDGGELPSPPTSRALTPDAFAALCRALPDPNRLGETRNGFILLFGRYTGLRAMELLNATIGDLVRNDVGWRVHVVGKGRKPRFVTVPAPAMKVLREYLESRGLPRIEDCPSETPLLAADGQPTGCPTYSAVHQSFSAFVRRAIRRSDMPATERAKAQRATQHWLRHTFATRFAEAGGAKDVLKEEMGHASEATTEAYYRAQERRRQAEMERIASLA